MKKRPILIHIEEYQYDWIVKASKKSKISISALFRSLIEKLIKRSA